MVIITAIYVIATIIICYFNYKTMKISQEQIKEMKKQFINTRNLSHMPILKVEKIDACDSLNVNGENTYYISDATSKNSHLNTMYFKVINIGHDVAQEVFYEWENYHKRYTKFHISSLPVNDYRIIKITFASNINKSDFHFPSMTITFMDINKVRYTQNLYFHLRSEDGRIQYINSSISAPRLKTKYFENKE